jgi:hypothetical protein
VPCSPPAFSAASSIASFRAPLILFDGQGDEAAADAASFVSLVSAVSVSGGETDGQVQSRMHQDGQ